MQLLEVIVVFAISCVALVWVALKLWRFFHPSEQDELTCTKDCSGSCSGCNQANCPVALEKRADKESSKD